MHDELRLCAKPGQENQLDVWGFFCFVWFVFFCFAMLVQTWAAHFIDHERAFVSTLHLRGVGLFEGIVGAFVLKFHMLWNRALILNKVIFWPLFTKAYISGSLTFCVQSLHCSRLWLRQSAATSSLHSVWHLSSHRKFLCSSASWRVMLKWESLQFLHLYIYSPDRHISLLQLHQGAVCSKTNRETV